MTYSDYLLRTFHAAAAVDKSCIDDAFRILKNAIVKDNTIYLIGNGGSAAIANHFETDLMKGVGTDTSVHPKVRSLVSNPSILTAIGNDIGFDCVFSYQLENLCRQGDVVIAISSSGNSPNIRKVIESDISMNVNLIGISGFNSDNALAEGSDVPIYIPASNYGIVEDVSSMIMHTLSQSLRKHLAIPGSDINSFTF